METQLICPNCRKTLPPGVPMGLCPECLIKAGFPTGTDPAVPSGPRFVPPTVEEMARLFPQLEIIGLIGQGGMGAVYKARQPALDRLVALKILPPSMANDPGFAERFNREARTLARLNHPNIVSVYDFGQAGTLNYLLMEFVDGSNLRDIEQTGTLSAEQALAIVPQICEALQFAHNEGIVHRDIKPENLLLDKKGRLKITDFGIAKILGVPAGQASLTGDRDILGTPHYMAPEQLEKPLTVDHRADIYSLGVVFYEMLTGELPLGKFSAPSKMVQVDVRLDEVVLHTLEKEPGRRYQHASQVKTDVETITSTKSTPASDSGAGLGSATGNIPPGSSLPAQSAVSDKIILPAFLLAFFFGIFGAHRFYVGKLRTGCLQLAGLGGCVLLTIVCATRMGRDMEPTAGILLATFICGCGTWAVIDWILIVCKAFTDGHGRRITHWVNPAPDPLKLDSGIAGGEATPVSPVDSKPAVMSQGMITAPAVGLLVAGILKLFSALTMLLLFATPDNDLLNSIFSHMGVFSPLHWNTFIGSNAVLFRLIPALVIIFGAIEMMKVRGYAWAMAAAIVAIVSCSLVGFPMGVWALIVLARPDAREAFAKAPAPPATGKWLWMLAAAVIAGILLVWTTGLIGHRSTADDASANNLVDSVSLAADVAQQDPVKPTAVDSQAGVLAPQQQQISPTNANASVSNQVAGQTGNLSAENVLKAPPAGLVHQVIEAGAASHFSRSLIVAPGGKLTMDVDRGEVRILGADQNTVEVQVDREVTRASDADAAKILKDEHVVLTQNGNEISLSAQEPLGLRRFSFWDWWNQPNLNVHYEITVPRTFDVQSATSGGDLKVAGIRGDANVKTMGGKLDCEDIGGNVDGQTMGGDVNATDCKGSLQLKTMGGSISIDDFAGPGIHASTEGGSVSANFAVAPKADCDLHTSGGNVTARVPAGAAINVDAHTMGGSVRTDLPVQVEGQVHDSSLRGTINGGGPLLKLETMGGNVEVLKR